jgi:hypothetical protein
MAYNNFTLELVIDRFDLRLVEDRFCQSLSAVEPQPEFLVVFDDLFELGESAKSEKAKSELLVAPVLAQARKLTNRQVQLFSGEEFNVDQERGLNGFCDFLFTRSVNRFAIEAPVLMLVEAKRGEIESGWGQCVAEMVAAQIYNRNRERAIPVIYGCVTSGRLWQFFKLEGDRITIDPNNYSLMPVQKILGILQWILSNK